MYPFDLIKLVPSNDNLLAHKCFLEARELLLHFAVKPVILRCTDIDTDRKDADGNLAAVILNSLWRSLGTQQPSTCAAEMPGI